jgi:hypothetical protein
MASSTQHHQNTPVKTDPAQGTVTVLDPHHRLFGCTFPLLKVVGEGEYCIIRLPGGAERRIPLGVTDRAQEVIEVYPLPVNLAAIKRLLLVYAQITSRDEPPPEEPRIPPVVREPFISRHEEQANVIQVPTY